jgi:hypothetical protein
MCFAVTQYSRSSTSIEKIVPIPFPFTMKVRNITLSVTVADCGVAFEAKAVERRTAAISDRQNSLSIGIHLSVR